MHATFTAGQAAQKFDAGQIGAHTHGYRSVVIVVGQLTPPLPVRQEVIVLSVQMIAGVARRAACSKARQFGGFRNIIAKGLYAEAALACFVVSKFIDGSLYRNAALLCRFGGEISRNTPTAGIVRPGEADHQSARRSPAG